METTSSESENKKGSGWYNSIPLAILIAGIMISGSVIYIGGNKSASITGNQQDQQATPTPIEDPSKLITANDPILGDAKARVTIVEFSDFQCPYCRSFFIDTFSQLKKDYIDTGKVRLVFRDYPLPFHAAAKPAALASLCANDQGKFWQYHDKVFGEQQKREPNTSVVTKTIDFSVTDLKTWATQLGLDTAKFNTCLDSAKYEAEVQADIVAGNEYGVSGTPSFFINGQLLVGAQPYSVFKQIIDQTLK